MGSQGRKSLRPVLVKAAEDVEHSKEVGPVECFLQYAVGTISMVIEGPGMQGEGDGIEAVTALHSTALKCQRHARLDNSKLVFD